MKNIILCLALMVSGSAFAGEKLLGSIVSVAGADTTNGTTPSPFVVPIGSLISIQCNATAYVITDDTTAVSATRGVTVATNSFFLTSVSSFEVITVLSQTSAIVRIAGPAAVTCLVWSRRGNE